MKEFLRVLREWGREGPGMRGRVISPGVLRRKAGALLS